MIPARHETAGPSGGPSDAHAPGAAGWLSLAAMPTFATMALLAGMSGEPASICTAANDALPLSGMALMYLLMSVFHMPPWLKRIFG
ncbi:hypothetical protein ACUSIJ_05925 [Pseudochelatococcus sp. B33]